MDEIDENKPILSGIIVKGEKGFRLFPVPPGHLPEEYENALKKTMIRTKNLPPEARIEIYSRFTGTLSEWRLEKDRLNSRFNLPGYCPKCSLE
ncbi:hypothetical protein A2303_04165 [Candidatus Falkowbacteria bacterium RIFOXYB2_FULL_47_14]|uniref:Uncharacterized protein n=1 Tax=Candidatus Falkowbacteria bacterium RIFOXYA2_FULL_47_19 TaxID=1797994 RepID=A0A1F5SK61_9BACT|nr:MAG: hypothetical protein A2227_04085 [Candidatus Falkowbacteria bacterium RIFOXYA2_FULL_47_19]OGF35367.1 MAG: hypothetical protein A2468_02255 [Candidatus Falkowbacteria bacterium RIFOXYC2_FULL_46_15]OGF43094.1 MAG: hypothetical protein A2303_04165 [Candidatus Falkowbacteria bacterium RIFOXYB2_FULL_47_14]